MCSDLAEVFADRALDDSQAVADRAGLGSGSAVIAGLAAYTDLVRRHYQVYGAEGAHSKKVKDIIYLDKFKDSCPTYHGIMQTGEGSWTDCDYRGAVDYLKTIVFYMGPTQSEGHDKEHWLPSAYRF